MEVVCCSDRNFIMTTGVMLKSLCVNNYDVDINIHVIIDNTVSIGDESSIKRTISDNPRHNVFFYTIDEKIISSFPQIGIYNKHVTQASYYRLFITDILPSTINKVLYLDGDIIVRHSLIELWNTDLKGYAIGAVADQCEGAISQYNRMQYNPIIGYFNAGVLLINLSYWRNNKLKEVFLGYINDFPERIKLHDQDVLNCVLKGNRITLPIKYNVQTSFFHRIETLDFDYWKYSIQIEEAIKDPYILHFSSGLKPWYEGCNHPMKLEFIKYKNLTEWKCVKLKKRPESIKQKIRNVLIWLGLVSVPPKVFRV